MLEQEVAFVRHPAALLVPDRGDRPFLLDGNDARSWGDGTAIFAANPAATLEVPAGGAAEPLDTLECFVRDHLAAGCVGVGVALSYDLKHSIERLTRRHPWPDEPLLYAAAFDRAYVAAAGRARLVGRDRGALAAAEAWFSRAFDDAAPSRPLPRVAVEAAMSRREYAAMVARAKEYIAAGDIYQANLSQSFGAEFDRAAAPALFAEWRGRFPAPFAAYVDGGDWVLVSNSPECFLDVRGNAIATYPIKGTRPVADGADRAAAAAELAADAKDLAEHVMIVDLERNDLGRICETGSVRVAAMQELRHFPMLVHMVSEIRGTLRAGVGLAGMLHATFPGGSITGAPKVRAMQIIEELEPRARSFYTGSIGWIEPGGRSRFNIAIRTALVGRDGLSFHAGGGIVADSDPDREYEETLAKSQSLFRVLSGAAAAAPSA